MALTSTPTVRRPTGRSGSILLTSTSTGHGHPSAITPIYIPGMWSVIILTAERPLSGNHGLLPSVPRDPRTGCPGRVPRHSAYSPALVGCHEGPYRPHGMPVKPRQGYVSWSVGEHRLLVVHMCDATSKSIHGLLTHLDKSDDMSLEARGFATVPQNKMNPPFRKIGPVSRL